MKLEPIEFEMDEQGVVRRPALHDGLVIGVLVGKDEARLLLKDTAGQEYALVMRGNLNMRTVDLVQGNILFDLTIRPCEPDDLWFITQLRRWQIEDSPTTSVLQSHERSSAEYLDAAVKAHRLLIYLCPTMGCEFFAVCESVEFHKRVD